MRSLPLKVATITVFALLSFAANSVLCRLALAEQSIDPASFTLVRLASGAVVLTLILGVFQRKGSWRFGNWTSAALLFGYAAAFSLAYVGLSAGTGALLLFGSVQATMILSAVRAQQHPKPTEWLGLALALAGLIYLVLPGIAAPPPLSAALMVSSGVAWGFYSLRGRSVADPTAATAGNFLLAVPFALALSVVFIGEASLTGNGIALAMTSGALTSGLGYVLWYSALPTLGATRAAVVQLLVPILAALSGIAVLDEHLTPRLAVAATLSLAGVCLAIFAKRR